MSWMKKLYDTYESCQTLVGVAEGSRTPLMPVYHTTQQAQIEAVIDTDGNWRSAQVLEDKSDRTTLIPCTEKSASRTSDPVLPHPLFDNLSYLAGDYLKYRTLEGEKQGRYAEYIARLSGWCGSPYAHPKVCAVLTYLKKGCLMGDLIRSGVLFADASGALPEKWEGEKADTPPIFKAVTNDQAGAFVRFQVVQAGGAEDLRSRIWQDKTVWQSFIDYQNSLETERDYCYVLGKEVPVSAVSPKYIRRPGDGAKLISANDASGFTYRGRFETPGQAFCVGRETTEKAHNALKWLIQRQAYANGDQVILAWRSDGAKTLDPCKNSLDLMVDLEDSEPIISTGEEFAQRFRHALAGYGGNLKGGEDACIIGLDSATPGRLSIFYYRELRERDFLDRVSLWHETCRWYFQDFPKSDKPREKSARPVPFIGAPAPETIVEAAYGRQVNDKLKKSAVQRLLPCVVDKAILPQDIMLCTVRRASNPVALDSGDYGKTLAVACALVRKYWNDEKNHGVKNIADYKERWKMTLDTRETDRNYLFGRLLAYAQQLESYALGVMGDRRSTNAERIQAAFSQHPAKTWRVLNDALKPYVQKLGTRANRYQNEINEIISILGMKDFTNEPLSEIYLVGYASQMNQFQEEMREAIRNKNKNMTADGGNEGEEQQ